MTEPDSRVLAVCGVKNSGKTTLIEALLPRLAEAGLRVAVVKHDGHAFTPDTPGTDSHRFFAAGACGTAVFDGEKYALTRRAAVTEAELFGQFPDADLILLEGGKHSPYPKIELVRAGVSATPACNGQGLLALVTDLPLDAGVPLLSPGNMDGILRLILDFAGRICPPPETPGGA